MRIKYPEELEIGDKLYDVFDNLLTGEIKIETVIISSNTSKGLNDGYVHIELTTGEIHRYSCKLIKSDKAIYPSDNYIIVAKLLANISQLREVSIFLDLLKDF